MRVEASALRDDFAHQVFSTVYIGGGTPSVLTEKQIEDLGAVMRDCFHVGNDAEITVEANPNTVTERNLASWRQIGVNRLSLGVQSFSDDVLCVLGRVHSAGQAYEAACIARKAGFGNIGIDLMYGVPRQGLSQWNESLDRALGFRPEHLSVYSLSYDEGSRFKAEADAGRLRPVDDDSAADMYEYAAGKLLNAGYIRYEVSNFAVPGFACRHNMNYWSRGEYLGLGPGAWSFIKGGRRRTIADVHEYRRRLLAGECITAETEVPSPDHSARELIMLSLRTAQGLDLPRFRERHGKRQFERLERALSRLSAEGLIAVRGDRLTFTDRGILLANDALTRLLG